MGPARKPRKTKPAPTTAERIRAERERLGLTISEAARRLAMRPDSYPQLEGAKGRAANPSLDTLCKLVRNGYRLEAIAPDLVTGSARVLTLIPGVDARVAGRPNVLSGLTDADDAILRELNENQMPADALGLIRRAIENRLLVIIRADHLRAGQALDR